MFGLQLLAQGLSVWHSRRMESCSGRSRSAVFSICEVREFCTMTWVSSCDAIRMRDKKHSQWETTQGRPDVFQLRLKLHGEFT